MNNVFKLLKSFSLIFPQPGIKIMAGDSDLEISVENGGASFPSDEDAPPAAPPRSAKRDKRVSWQEGLKDTTTSDVTADPVASKQPVEVALPEISELWWNEEGLDDGRENFEPSNDLE